VPGSPRPHWEGTAPPALHLVAGGDAEKVAAGGQGARGQLRQDQPRGAGRLLGIEDRAALEEVGEGQRLSMKTV
jgi:hypothetical protein